MQVQRHRQDLTVNARNNNQTESNIQMSLRTVTQYPNSVTIDETNLPQIYCNKPALEIRTYWHKFIISDVHGLRRNLVLKLLFEHVSPQEFIPLCYTQQGRGAFFFARICGPTIEKLCSDKLTVPNPYDKTKPFKLKIVLKYSSTNVIKVDLTQNLLTVLHKRLKSQVLCLNNFCEDPDLTDFFLLSQPRLLAFVLNVAKSLKPKAIKLCNNEIKTLDAFRIMPTNSIVSLDLRQNLIRDLEELKYLDSLNITELWLEGNPLCELYDEYSYVEQVIKHCPKIEKLDGFLLRQNGVPSFRRNYLCDISAFQIVDQFLERYFPTYDTKNLMKLQTFYHKDAVFSMTAEFSPSNSQLKSYKPHSRNLLNAPSNTNNLYVGSGEIIKLFNLLPRSDHDPYSFTVDVVFHTAKCAIVVVTGVFREVLNIGTILGFNRCFVLERRGELFCISNEQMHVFSALPSQQITAFKKPNILQEAKDAAQQNQMVNTFAVITSLTKDWAKMFLEECHYNLKHAMLLFVDLYKSDKIPSEGFKSLE